LAARPALLLCTYADRGYAMFAVPYAWFALSSCPNAFVEVLLGDFAHFEATQALAIDQLRRRFGNRFLFRQSQAIVDRPSLSPNVVRFIEQPHTCADNVYIGDIDLLITDDVSSVHAALMQEYGLPYSNIIRPRRYPGGERRMSGRNRSSDGVVSRRRSLSQDAPHPSHEASRPCPREPIEARTHGARSCTSSSAVG